MTHITDERVVGNHADMGTSLPAASRKPLTLLGIHRAGIRRSTRHREMALAQSVWDSEGGSVSGGAEGLPQAPSHLGR
jgi:hypothetical protein